jgi:hypothetical protein
MRQHLLCACALAALAFGAAAPAWAHAGHEHGTEASAGKRPDVHRQAHGSRKSQAQRRRSGHTHRGQEARRHSHAHGAGAKGHAHADDDHGPGKAHGHDDDDKEHGAGDHHGLETENIFGFTEGTDTGEKGEKEVNTDFVGRLGKRRAVIVVDPAQDGAPPTVLSPRSSYLAIGNVTALEYGVTDDLKFALGGAFGYHDIRNVQDLVDRNAFNFNGLSTELKWRFLDRSKSLVGLAIAVSPHWNRVDEVSGARVDTYGLETRLMADAALIPDTLFAAANLVYEPEAAHVREFDPETGAFREWERESNFEASAALAGVITPNVLIGAEVRYLTRYQGTFFDRFEGRAWYAGPTFFAKLSEHAYIKAAWSVQFAGRAADEPDRSLDLVNYERHQIKVKLGMTF